MGIFHQKRIQKLEEMAENPLLKSLSSFMRRPYSKEFITILKKKTCEYPLKCSGFVIMLAENKTLWREKEAAVRPYLCWRDTLCGVSHGVPFRASPAVKHGASPSGIVGAYMDVLCSQPFLHVVTSPSLSEKRRGCTAIFCEAWIQ